MSILKRKKLNLIRTEYGMDNLSNNLPKRAGENHRGNPNRYFHVMTEGWFVYTREGVRGPFVDRDLAQSFLQSHISEIKAEDDPSNSWRL